MSVEKMREEFEAWWRKTMNTEVMDLHRCEFPMQKPDFVQPYACHETDRAWWAWHASRVTINAPQFLGYKFEGCRYYDADSVDEAIEDLGLKVKP